jgi:peroxiredoxin
MKKYIKISIVLLLIGVFGYFGYQVISKINHKKEVAENIKSIPNFEYLGLNGKVYTEKNLKPDTPTLFVYFNSDCEFCNEEAKMIKENSEQLEAVQIIFISFQTQEEISAFATRHQLLNYGNITFLRDSKVTFATTFDVKSLPCLVLYDKDQNLIEKIKGQTKVALILQKLRVAN